MLRYCNLIISIFCLFVLVSCAKTESHDLRLYQSCLQGVTQNRLLLKVPLGKDVKHELNACVDGNTELLIRRLRNVEVKYIEISHQDQNLVTEGELESKKSDPSVKLYGVIVMTLHDSDKSIFREWIQMPNPSNRVFITLDNEVRSMFILTNNISKEQLQLDIGEDLSLIDPTFSALKTLIVSD